MFSKLKALFDVFRLGKSVLNPAAWKLGQITGTMLASLLLALVNLGALFGLSVPIDPNTANAIGVGIVAIANVALTLATSKTVGVPGMQPHVEPTPDAMPSSQTAPASPAEAPRSAPVSRFDSATRQRAEEYLRDRAGNPGDREFQAP